MHPHTIDWLRNVEINADATLAEKRWDTAAKYAADLTVPQIENLLRLFIFNKPDATLVSSFTEELLKHDKEFPISGNAEKVRVMAGLVMATTFEASSREADAFALGIHAARMGGTRGQPAVSGIVEEGEKYLLHEAASSRPDDFEAEQAGYTTKLGKKYTAMQEAEAGEDTEKTQKARQAYHSAIADQALAKRVRQLAEETQLLWLVIGEYSPSLRQATASLSATSYALVVAAEVAARVNILPPPPSIYAILIRALKPCNTGTKKVTVAELLEEANADWRAMQVVSMPAGAARPLLPMTTALETMQEVGNAKHVTAALVKRCPGLKGELTFSPAEAARQYFSELMFLTALKRV